MTTKSTIKDDASIVILTGAGVSAESGLQTFRAEDGLWENYSVEEVATPEAFEENPELVQEFYNLRRKQLATVEPNDAHIALSYLEKSWPGDVLLVTQNIDNLHERAGSKNLIHMHGELASARCLYTGLSEKWSGDINEKSKCECCNSFGNLRPDIVWFGEMPMKLDDIYKSLHQADLFIAIGTSGHVWPAAGFVQEARQQGWAHTIEMNLEPSAVASEFDESIYGLATEKVPTLVERLLGTIE